MARRGYLQRPRNGQIFRALMNPKLFKEGTSLATYMNGCATFIFCNIVIKSFFLWQSPTLQKITYRKAKRRKS